MAALTPSFRGRSSLLEEGDRVAGRRATAQGVTRRNRSARSFLPRDHRDPVTWSSWTAGRPSSGQAELDMSPRQALAPPQPGHRVRGLAWGVRGDASI